MRIAKAVYWSGGVPVAVISIGFLLPFQISRQWGFVCENTGSRKGYREWRFGFRTDSWTNTSELERFMRENYPQTVTNRWVSYNGTGRNVFGQAVLYGHAFPALVHVKTDDLDVYTAKLSDHEKKKLYEFFTTASHESARKKADVIIWELVNRSATKE